MRWFKNHVDLHRHEDVTLLLDAAKDRLAAFGFLVTMLAAIAEHWDGQSEPMLTHSIGGWARVLGCHTNLIRYYLGSPKDGPGLMRHCRLVRVGFEGDKCSVACESLRSWQDEWTRKQRVQGNKPHPVTPELLRIDQTRPEQNRTHHTTTRAGGGSEVISVKGIVDNVARNLGSRG